jgi:hypothetical protein
MTRADRKKLLRAWQADDAAAVQRNGVVRHERWYFVVHLGLARRSTPEARYEVQLLDEDGRAIEVATFAALHSSVELGASAVPIDVLRSAMELPEGQGCFVDEAGWELTPHGHRVAADQASVTGGRHRDPAWRGKA